VSPLTQGLRYRAACDAKTVLQQVVNSAVANSYTNTAKNKQYDKSAYFTPGWMAF